MVAFYNQGDQDIYKSGQHFVPQEKYRLGYTAPVQGGGQDASTPSFGIPATQAFTNSGGGGGGENYSGGNFQQVVDARQNRLNKPIDTSTFMGKVKDFMNPQSANDIMTNGYREPRFQPGIIGTIMGKFDNYRNLPQADQAFISKNMGYTGPTIFGANNSGLSKDEFGINTRSLFGNYAQHSEDMAAEDGDLAATVADQEARGIFDTIQSQQLAFHQKKQKEELAQKKEEFDKPGGTGEQVDAIKTEIESGKYSGSSDFAQQNQAAVGGGAEGKADNTDNSKDTGTNQGYSQHYAKGGRTGYFFGGRTGFKNGGLASIL